MARFHNKVWDAESVSGHRHAESEPKQQLLVATLIWLRSLDSYLGYANLIRLLVRPCNDLTLGLGKIDMPANRLVVSDGKVYEIYGLKHSFVWTQTAYAPLNLAGIQLVAEFALIKLPWLEWALAHAMVMLSDAGIDWIPKPKPKTIGGLEVADFL